MNTQTGITTIFTDVGGVLLTNGWGRSNRKKAVEIFNLDPIETEERHHLTFDTYEVGKLSLDEYLGRVIFYKERTFSVNDFSGFMFEQSQPYPEMIDLMSSLKKKYNLKIAVVNNEGRELNDYRIKKFKLDSFVDFFISSSFVHFRKPDADIFKLALDVAQVPVNEIVYIDDRPLFVQVAEGLGLKGIVHTDVESTVEKLKILGLE
ncbi:MAG: HAD hydrolase-like protein [Bacteroidetes bacterium]|nr:HAD hydrolase-like protein [Bacteroidota bacterium]